jgi:hypothetical protein
MTMLQVSPLTDGDVFRTLVDAYTTNGVPLPVVALLLFGSIGLAYYVVQQRIIIPVVMLAIVGGVTIARAPGIFLQAIAGILLVGLAGIGYILFNRVRVT